MKKKIVVTFMIIVIIIAGIIEYKANTRPYGISTIEACTWSDNFHERPLIVQGHDGEESVGEFYKYNNSLYYVSSVDHLFMMSRPPDLWEDSYLYSYDCQTNIAKDMNIDNHGFYKMRMIQGGKGNLVLLFENMPESPSAYFIMNLNNNNLEKITIEKFDGFSKYKTNIKEKIESMYNNIRLEDYYSGRSFDEYRSKFEKPISTDYWYDISNMNTDLVGDIIHDIRASREWIDISVAKIDLINKKIIFTK